MGHSWGGVLLLSVLARFPEYREFVAGVVLFQAKRTIQVRNREVFSQDRPFWNRGARALVALHGYLPARENIGWAFRTTRRDFSHAESRAWVRPGPWVDPRDGFD